MDTINPLSLLEVSLIEPIEEDDDCIIIENDKGTHNFNGRNQNNSNHITQYDVSGEYFSSQYPQEVPKWIADPLFLKPINSNEVNMTILLVKDIIQSLSSPSTGELEYRKVAYSNPFTVLKEKLHCTICQAHIGCDIQSDNAKEHPVLKVLICLSCFTRYSLINFLLNDKGKELNCRWCGRGQYESKTPLRTCQQCPFSFCEDCSTRNCSSYNEPRFPWTCFVCNRRILWSARATFWALLTLKNILLLNPDNELAKCNGDISTCCLWKVKTAKQKNEAVPISHLWTFIGDTNQPVMPCIQNGSKELGPIQVLSPPSLDSFSILSSYHAAEYSPKVQKTKAKSNPNRNRNRKPKSVAKCKKQQVKKNELSIKHQNSVPILSKPIEEQSTNTKQEKTQHWIKAKLVGYMADIDKFRNKLENINNASDFDDNSDKTDEKVDTIIKLFSLHENLLRSCQLNLTNEWKERKARESLEKFDPNVHELKNEPTITNNLSSSVLKKQEKRESLEKFDQNVHELENEPTATNNLISSVVKKQKKGQKKQSTKSLLNLKHYHNKNISHSQNGIIKDCYVKLEQLKMPPVIQKS